MTGRFSTHHIPDTGSPFIPGEIVRLDQSSGQVQIVKDPDGDYEVHSCRPATEYTGGVPLLRVGLKRCHHEPQGWREPQPSPSDLGRQVRWVDRP